MKFLKFGNSKNFIVFLHGWAADKKSFLWVKDYIKNHTLLFLDFAGFGESNEPERPYSVFNYAQELKNLLDEFEIEKLMLVGHSFGGRVGIKFAAIYQQVYFDFKLCLIDSAGIKPRRGFGYFFKVYKYKILKKIAKKHKNIEKYISKCGSDDYKKLSPIMKESFKLIVNEDLSCDAKSVTNPTIIVWGEKDKDTKLYMARKLNKLIKYSRLFIIKNAGHFSFLDNPQEFLIILDTFIKKQ